jgi:hypothetical protein
MFVYTLATQHGKITMQASNSIIDHCLKAGNIGILLDGEAI